MATASPKRFDDGPQAIYSLKPDPAIETQTGSLIPLSIKGLRVIPSPFFTFLAENLLDFNQVGADGQSSCVFGGEAVGSQINSAALVQFSKDNSMIPY